MTAREFAVPVDHPCLAGHFPGNPVVPAVMLLELVQRALAQELGRAVHLAAVPAAKFVSPLLPGEDVSVELAVENSSARFRLVRGGQELASGRVEFA